MCGIFGWLTPGRGVARSRAADAVNTMRHRGPDDEGYLLCSLENGTATLAGGDETSGDLCLPSWRDEACVPGADVVMGFRRLAIHDLSAAGHQPMGTPDGRLWIVFNGEVYNFPELRVELEREGVGFQSRTDTEVILRAYERWGPECLHRFNGMWGLAILDLREAGRPRLFLARDRCGVKPLFYTTDEAGGVAFASELKSLLGLRDQKWKVDEVAAGNFLAWGRYPSAQAGGTFLKDVRMLPPGCCAEWTGRDLKIRRWWELKPDGDGTKGDETEAIERLRFLLEDAVRLRLRADVPVGSCLSGGLDSSAIVGQVNQLLRDGRSTTNTARQHTFSAVYQQDGPYNERRFIDRVLETVPATGHFTYPDGERLAADFERLVWHQDEPFAFTSVFAQWCVMEKVRQEGVTVLLDGQAADELFAGYRPYQWWFREMIRQGRPLGAWNEARAVVRETGDKPWKHLLRGGVMGVLPDSMVQSVTRAGYRSAFRSAASMVLRPGKRDSVLEQVNDENSPESYPWRRVTESLEDHLRGMVTEFSLPRLLRYEDRNSMAFSVESRVPFTDYRLVEYAFSPALRGLKLKAGWAKWCLRKAVDGLAPQDIIWRRDKMGFGTPEAGLVQHLADARGHAEKLSGVAADYIEPAAMRKVMAAASNGSADKEGVSLAFRCMVFDSWSAQFPVC